MNAAHDVASFHAPVEELGSSDISSMVREVYLEAGVDYPEMNEADSASKPLRKTKSPSKKAQDAKYYDYLARTLGEALEAKSPADSDSPLTHAQENYCDACDSTECHCDDVNEGKMKEIDIDLKELSDLEFYGKYGKTKEEIKAALGEDQHNMEENIGDDYVNKDEKLKRMGAKPLSVLDKFKIMPGQAKAMTKGDSEDDLLHYNKLKSKSTNEETEFNEAIEKMRKIAGLK
jgi:hypothetical protein